MKLEHDERHIKQIINGYNVDISYMFGSDDKNDFMKK